MNLTLVKQIIHTKTFRALIILAILYFAGFVVFLKWIEPDPNKVPGQSGMFFRDFLWIFYWRWYLDWPIIFGFILMGILFSSLMQLLSRKIKTQTIATYIWPLILMIFNYIGMLAIDISVTYFADTTFNGTWDSSEILLFGLTAERLYHGFFFWFIPAFVIVGLPVNTFIYNQRYRFLFRQQFVLMAGFSWCLGCLDPVVSQILWNDWQLFGTWSMMGFDPMWAQGWIAHYIIFGALWLIAAWLVKHIIQELEQKQININKSN
jgi:hypothetical protein